MPLLPIRARPRRNDHRCPRLRMRAGDYRVLCTVDEGRLVVLVLDAGHLWVPKTYATRRYS